MTITIPMVQDMLVSYEFKEYFADKASPGFKYIEFLSFSTKSFSPSVLYIANTAQLRYIRQANLPDICIVCIGRQSTVENFLQTHTINLLLLPEKAELFEISNALLKGFRSLRKWDSDFHAMISSNQGFQKLAEHCGKLFGEAPFLMSSPSFNIVGRSLMETPYNDKVSGVLQRGYLTKEEADTLSLMGYPTHRNNFLNAVLIDPPSMMDCSFFLVSFPLHFTRLAFMAVYFVTGSPTAGQLDLFRYISEEISNYCEKMESPDTLAPSSLELLIEDLMTHTYGDETFLIERAKRLHLPINETYSIGVILWDAYSRDQAEYLLWRIRYGLGNSIYRVIRYKDSVLMLVKGGVPQAEMERNINEVLGQFSNILLVGNGRIGFSTDIGSLFKIDIAYRQACAAVHLGKSLNPNHAIYFYSRYYIYDMIDCYKEKYRPEDFFVEQLRLLDNDTEGSFNSFRLLRIHLLCERSLSSTARIMHLHRNSVIYRLGKIESLLGIDLNDPDVRLRLIMSFHIIERTDGKLFEEPGHEAGSSDDFSNKT